MYEIDLKSAIETNVIKLGNLTMEAFDDRLLVIEDEFRSGYECPTCVGKKKIKSPELEELVCENCDGTGKSVISKEARCSACKGTGRTICPTCLGKGGVIVVAEASERRPTTGIVVSIGDKIFCKRCDGKGFIGDAGEDGLTVTSCNLCKGTGGTRTIERGQSVMYTSFCGHVYDLETSAGQVTIRVIQESDILVKVAGHLELRRMKKSQALGTAA
jgi:DnaJ-class molecular chaperone